MGRQVSERSPCGPSSDAPAAEKRVARRENMTGLQKNHRQVGIVITNGRVEESVVDGEGGGMEREREREKKRRVGGC